MIIEILIWLIFFIWARWLWHHCPPIITAEDFENPEFQYCYTTTPTRQLGVYVGACILFATLLWLNAFAIGELLWREVFLPFAAEYSWVRALVLFVVVGALLALLRLPIVRRLAVDVCVFFQRYQFFPMLPSPKEEHLISQLSNLPIGVLPPDIVASLDQKTEFSDEHLKGLYEQYQRLEVVIVELKQLAKKKPKVIGRFYFGGEWELIQNQFSVIERQMHSNTSDVDKALVSKIRSCLYLAYSLLTRVIMETSNSTSESREKFRYFGFKVDMPD